jgi:diacylglycerol kinase family enzyme
MPVAGHPRSQAPHGLATVRVVANTAAGGVGPDVGLRLAEIASDFALDMEVAETGPEALRRTLAAAVAAAPDLVVVLGGDGTAALAASLCGSGGPVLAPLAGGTMNMLPHALYGLRPWPQALREALAGGRVVEVSGGEAAGRVFHVAAILGEPALWAEAREAVRRRPHLILAHARRAWARAFSGRLRYSLDGGETRKAEALALLTPLASRALESDDALEAAAIDPHDALEAFRLGLAALMGRWRDDPAVTARPCRQGRVWAKGAIPAVLDGEPCRLPSPVRFGFRPAVFRALVPADYRPLERPADRPIALPMGEAPA